MENKEVTKSISLKVNVGEYQNIDFFCSAKAEANGDSDEVGQKLHDYCVDQVVKDYKKSLKFLAQLVSKEAREKLLGKEVL